MGVTSTMAGVASNDRQIQLRQPNSTSDQWLVLHPPALVHNPGYVIRTNLPAAQSDAAATVRAYKSLSGVEHAFRSLKTVDLELRPVFHWTAPRVRAHVLLCMLAYYLEWHMCQSLAPMLFDEPDPAARD